MKKRKKVSRHRGSHTHGRGFKKKARGKGHRGGIGKAGTGKRADHKKSLIIKESGKKYFGRSKTLRKGQPKEKLKVINLDEVINKYPKEHEINLKGYKILSRGSVTKKLTIKASAASKTAIDKVKKTGGDVVIN